MIGSGPSSVEGNPPARRTVLHLAPHPDDELLGGPAIMLALQASGHRIINLACSLGRPADRERREAEARESSRRTGFELVIPSRPVAIGSTDDPDAAEPELAALIADLVRREAVDIVFSPSPHDGHPGHEVVGRAALDALSRLDGKAPVWWMWGLWADLPFPTLITYFAEERLQQVLRALDAHAGELDRNDYRRLVRGRAEANAVLGPERVFGLGARGGRGEFAELATEVVLRDRDWLLGSRRELDPREPLVEPTRASISAWLREPSLTQRFVRPGS
ncbi:MAG TPA: PIG-L family deacetylase [Solirubrobacterales bacterium]|nr:PIG-L family deacetylase [Solirubrobacterales bacterium]